ncbi:tetratricopeptide repeat protein [Lentisphaerota bacterium ZTH]|nr:tetratricopeptide repeat protein [Lentisphaerota bacterium]WET06622.1 tetratricopeptide repeat protein [Lentisphaerota bacterium ZTH]
MNKSLLPLIIVLGIIVTATAVLVNIRDARTNATGDFSSAPTSMSLSPYTQAQTVPLKFKKTDEEIRYQVNRIMLQAYNALERGDIDQAASQVKTILVFEPDNYDALSLLGRIYYIRHEFKSAESIYRRLMVINSKDPAVRNNLGQTLLKQQKYKQAVNELKAAFKFKPDSGIISVNLAGALSREGNSRLSLMYFQKAYKLMGDRILTVAHTPDLDPVRNKPAFRKIIAEARAEMLRKSMDSKEKTVRNQKATNSGTYEQNKNTTGAVEQ